MRDERPERKVTRRTAIQGILAGTAGLAASVRRAVGQTQPQRPLTSPMQPSGAKLIETQPTGSQIWQIETQLKMSHTYASIYGERSWCSGDSRYFVYLRQNEYLWSRNDHEYMLVELGTWKRRRLDISTGRRGVAISHSGVFYYLKHFAEDDTVYLMRADLGRGEPEKLVPIRRFVLTLGTATTDGRYYAYGTVLDPTWKRFGIVLVDLKTGQEKVIDEDPYLCNPHPHFEPGEGKCLMIQHNRGCQFSPEGERIRIVGPEGATLYLLSVPDGKRTPLKVGKPYTAPISGHEVWAGATKEIWMTAGDLWAIREGESAQKLTDGFNFVHVHASRCGRYFLCGDHCGEYDLVLGCRKTGKTGVVCAAKTKTDGPPRTTKNTHPRPYLTPDLKWAIFLSNRSGSPQVYAASVPEGLVEKVSEA
ncbi:MAG: hypothetical protein JXQ75_14300 [Phycisphaerae bacterium]|nr:hypothetical protein [Phycisphaerae bacterium]